MTEFTNKHDPKTLDDECYPDAYYGDGPACIDTTHEQRVALFRKWKRDDQCMSWGAFARTVQPTYHMNGAIVIRWCNMYLAIETDGYTHS